MTGKVPEKSGEKGLAQNWSQTGRRSVAAGKNIAENEKDKIH